MFSKGKKDNEVAREQHEQLEYAQQRVREKKSLYNHLIIFLVGAVFLFLIHKVFKYGEAYDWSTWAILAWAFVWVLHAVNVFVTSKFMGKEWERQQRERLVRRQRERINQMQQEIETEFPEKNINKKKDDWDTSPSSQP